MSKSNILEYAKKTMHFPSQNFVLGKNKFSNYNFFGKVLYIYMTYIYNKLCNK